MGTDTDTDVDEDEVVWDVGEGEDSKRTSEDFPKEEILAAVAWLEVKLCSCVRLTECSVQGCQGASEASNIERLQKTNYINKATNERE